MRAGAQDGNDTGRRPTANIEVLNTIGERFDEHAVTVDSLVNRLTGDLKAGDSFRTAYERWQTAQMNLNKVLQEISEGLKTGASSGTQAEQDSQTGPR